ncbi:hypothetical protein BRAS3843_470056 [Bradyrhizobium sp. STM 3843]|nr:hypothetical protein BRAS3843_470056 [Bradyrhizobium sp. STM 3843]
MYWRLHVKESPTALEAARALFDEANLALVRGVAGELSTKRKRRRLSRIRRGRPARAARFRTDGA